MTQAIAVGIDIGGTKIAYAVLHEDGEILDCVQNPIRKGQTVAETISEMAIQVEMLTAKSHAPLAGIGIGCPGEVNPASGLVKNAVNLGWKDVNLVDEMRARLPLKVPVLIRKDADANLLGEYTYGSAQGYADVTYLCIGSGLGCSIIAGGRLVEGATGTAGGIGHVRLIGNDEVCTCGLTGCVESLVSGPGLVRRARRLLDASLGKPKWVSSLTPASILEAAGKSDGLARQALADVSNGLGQAMAMIVAIVNPELIVIGGGLGLAGFDVIIPPAIDEMKAHSLPHTYENLKILPARIHASAVGAASLVWNYLSDSANKGGD